MTRKLIFSPEVSALMDSRQRRRIQERMRTGEIICAVCGQDIGAYDTLTVVALRKDAIRQLVVQGAHPGCYPSTVVAMTGDRSHVGPATIAWVHGFLPDGRPYLAIFHFMQIVITDPGAGRQFDAYRQYLQKEGFRLIDDTAAARPPETGWRCRVGAALTVQVVDGSGILREEPDGHVTQPWLHAVQENGEKAVLFEIPNAKDARDANAEIVRAMDEERCYAATVRVERV